MYKTFEFFFLFFQYWKGADIEHRPKRATINSRMKYITKKNAQRTALCSASRVFLLIRTAVLLSQKKEPFAAVGRWNFDKSKFAHEPQLIYSILSQSQLPGMGLRSRVRGGLSITRAQFDVTFLFEDLLICCPKITRADPARHFWKLILTNTLHCQT